MMYLSSTSSVLTDIFTKGIAVITIEKSDPLSSESYYLTGILSAELAAITGDSGKSNFTIDSMDGDRSLWGDGLQPAHSSAARY